MKGQSTTEYLLLVAVAIIAGLAAISILSYNGGSQNQLKQVETELYWAQLRPIGILSSEVTDDGKLTLKIHNKEAESVLITGAQAGGVTIPLDEPVPLAPGETKTLTLSLSGGGGSGSSGGGGSPSPSPSSPDGLCQFHGFCIVYQMGELGGLVECGNIALVTACPQSCIPDDGGCQGNSDCCSGNCLDSVCACIPDNSPISCDNDDSSCCSGLCINMTSNFTCLSCIPSGSEHLCLNDSQCCAGLSCDNITGLCTLPCGEYDSECTSDNECCSNYCADGRWCDCIPQDAPIICTNDSQCCEGLSCTSGVCSSATTCLPIGEICANDAGCCTGYCQLSMFENRCACIPDGNPSVCEGDSDCCSNNCVEGTCCGQLGGQCTYNYTCCSGICNGGYCDTQSACHAGGDTCYAYRYTQYCCSGLCTNSTCQECIPAGYYCMLSQDCCEGSSCIGTSNPPYYSGCWPDGQCRNNGMQCSSHGQCCSGVCRNGYCAANSTIALGQPCTMPIECQSGRCIDNPSSPPTGSVCCLFGGTCTYVGSGQECCTGTCDYSHTCPACSNPGEGCNYDSDCCYSGFTCQDGKCQMG